MALWVKGLLCRQKGLSSESRHTRKACDPGDRKAETSGSWSLLTSLSNQNGKLQVQ